MVLVYEVVVPPAENVPSGVGMQEAEAALYR